MAPFGSKNALGNKGGRPITYEVDEVAERLDEWSQKESSIAFSGFCAEMSLDPDFFYDSVARHPKFSGSYRIAKQRLAHRRAQMYNSDALKEKDFLMYQKHYDAFLKREDRDDLQFELKIKNLLDSQYNEQTLSEFKKLMEEVQAAQKVRKTKENKSKTASKS